MYMNRIVKLVLLMAEQLSPFEEVASAQILATYGYRDLRVRFIFHRPDSLGNSHAILESNRSTSSWNRRLDNSVRVRRFEVISRRASCHINQLACLLAVRGGLRTTEAL